MNLRVGVVYIWIVLGEHSFFSFSLFFPPFLSTSLDGNEDKERMGIKERICTDFEFFVRKIDGLNVILICLKEVKV